MCGIAGIISTEKTKFNIDHFNILGAFNDERGGDSCGIFIDNTVTYGISDNALFRNYMLGIDYPEEASIALLHCRKASPGMMINEAQAQPIVFRNNFGEIEYVVMHNGTIYNAATLAIRYLPKFETYGLSDSQIMANIMYHKGYDVLKEYIGTAVFVIVDYRQGDPVVMLFKGNSIYNELHSNSERPLYCAYINNKFYFSSLYSSLYCIDHNVSIFDVPTNKMLVVADNTLLNYCEIDRTQIKKPEVVKSNKSGQVSWNIAKQLYMFGGNPAHGVYKLYPTGMTTTYESTLTHEFCFFEGRLLYNKECFDFLSDIQNLFKEVSLIAEVPEIIDYFAYGCIKIKDGYYKVNENFEYYVVKDAEWSTLFTNTLSHKIHGTSQVHTFTYPTDATNHFNNQKVPEFDFNMLEDKIYKKLYSIYDNLQLQ